MKNLEPEIENYLKNNNFKIGISNGIFTHVRIDGHGHGGSNFKRNCFCCQLKYDGFSNNINCLCCIEPYVPKLFIKDILNNDLNEEIDEVNLINNIFPKLSLSYYLN